ncbi:MAG: hypothetical protein JWO53_579 [Chlamydiia bacterium]|nr:hypothetical protein [Chlamydiia bacterium]
MNPLSKNNKRSENEKSSFDWRQQSSCRFGRTAQQLCPSQFSLDRFHGINKRDRGLRCLSIRIKRVTAATQRAIEKLQKSHIENIKNAFPPNLLDLNQLNAFQEYTKRLIAIVHQAITTLPSKDLNLDHFQEKFESVKSAIQNLYKKTFYPIYQDELKKIKENYITKFAELLRYENPKLKDVTCCYFYTDYVQGITKFQDSAVKKLQLPQEDHPLFVKEFFGRFELELKEFHKKAIASLYTQIAQRA